MKTYPTNAQNVMPGPFLFYVRLIRLVRFGIFQEDFGTSCYVFVRFVHFGTLGYPVKLVYMMLSLEEKLEANGIEGHILSFIKALYNRDTIVYATKVGEASGMVSDPIPIERGLRQGCPTSPTFFYKLSMIYLTG
jgi:hypothetical protein